MVVPLVQGLGRFKTATVSEVQEQFQEKQSRGVPNVTLMDRRNQPSTYTNSKCSLMQSVNSLNCEFVFNDCSRVLNRLMALTRDSPDGVASFFNVSCTITFLQHLDVFIIRTQNGFVYFLEGALQTSKIGTQTRGKVFVYKTSFNLGMGQKRIRTSQK